MMGLIVSALSGTLIRWVVGFVIAGGLWLTIKLHYEHKGVVKEQARQERVHKSNVKKAAKARKRIEAIPDSNLYDRYFRD